MTRSIFFICLLFAGTQSFAATSTSCSGSDMTYKEANQILNGATTAQITPYKSYYRMRQCTKTHGCTAWLYEVETASAAGDNVSLAKHANGNIEVIVTSEGSPMSCGFIGLTPLKCKDAYSYLEFNGHLKSHCFRMSAEEAPAITDDSGSYDDGQDILYGQF